MKSEMKQPQTEAKEAEAHEGSEAVVARQQAGRRAAGRGGEAALERGRADRCRGRAARDGSGAAAALPASSKAMWQ